MRTMGLFFIRLFVYYPSGGCSPDMSILLGVRDGGSGMSGEAGLVVWFWPFLLQYQLRSIISHLLRHIG